MTNSPRHNASPPSLLVGLIGFASVTSGLFRRKRDRPSRSDAIEEVFGTISGIFEAAAQVKPEWREQWRARQDTSLPPRYELLDDRTVVAVHDLRFAHALLQRNRWRSIVDPMFTDDDEQAWLGFARAVAPTGSALLATRDSHASRFLADELDWLDAAIEQFADAWRQVTRAESIESPVTRRAAEGIYLHVYLGIQLGERFIERVRMEAAEHGK